jgi:short subunit fatty acids transporter
MSYGLRVWNSSGVLTLDITDRLTRIVSTHSFSFFVPNEIYVSEKSFNIIVPNISANGAWFVSGTSMSPATDGVGQNLGRYTYIIGSGVVTVRVGKIDSGGFNATGVVSVYTL